MVRTPQRARRARMRSALLAAAGQVFADRGYHGATLHDVVVRAGVSKGALYHYFPSKQELFLALLKARLGEVMDDAEALIARRGAGQGQVGLAAEAFLRRAGHPRWLPLLLEFLAYGSRDRQARAGVVEHFLRPARERIAVMLRRIAPEALDGAAVSVEELSVAIAALGNGLAIERAFDPAAVPEDLVGRILGVLIAGLKAQSATTPAAAPTTPPPQSG